MEKICLNNKKFHVNNNTVVTVKEVIFIKFKNIFLKLFVIILLIIPLSVVAYSSKVIPGGETIGIEVKSKGVLVVGFYEVDNKLIAKEAGFRPGDLIIKVNDTTISSIEDMLNVIEHRKSEMIKFTILRNSKEKDITLELKTTPDAVTKTGLYVKDKINGVGTLSYIDPNTKIFGSLGHEILESKTSTKFEIKDGSIYEANVSSITKSRVGTAGEKNASYNKEEVYGEINENTISGIYGTYTDDIAGKETIEIGKKETATTGEAIIRTVVEDNKVETFTINILKLNLDTTTKNILFEITDTKLLNKTGGIIQGMSGSPIIQNDKLIGAVNYVVVNDPKKGYGIFIETMLQEGEN